MSEFYELSIENYKGPLETLLDMVVEKKMEITMISLAAVTADFLAYVKTIEENPAYRVIVADFLVIASKLIFIKSKVLIPNLSFTPEEEEDIKNLEERLKFYRKIKDGETHIGKLWNSKAFMGKRDFLLTSQSIFFPPRNISSDILHILIQKIHGELEHMVIPIKTIAPEIISLKQKIAEVLERITKTPSHFSNLSRSHSRGEVIVFFLAVLQLVKDMILHVDQKDHFDEILIAKREKTE